ncbi:Ankyrin repeat-containing domain [Phytophthora cactorum]|nr:Ankyrin repeat-containing domain [Phytophthora cactorum]
MDGAAARGRVVIMEWLHSSRSEGCSALAATGAAANGHLHALEWLIQHFPQHSSRSRCLIAAAENGRIEIARYLRPQMHWFDATPAIVAAAARGRIGCLQALLPGNTSDAFIVAAANGRVEVLEFFIDNGYNGNVAVTNASLKKAARFGHTAVIQLLLPECNVIGVGNAFALRRNGIKQAWWFCYWRGNHIGAWMAYHRCTNLCQLCFTFVSRIGCAAIVKALVDRFPFVSIRPALLLATENRQYEVVELLLHSSDSSILSTIGKAVENAATCGDTKRQNY